MSRNTTSSKKLVWCTVNNVIQILLYKTQFTCYHNCFLFMYGTNYFVIINFHMD